MKKLILGCVAILSLGFGLGYGTAMIVNRDRYEIIKFSAPSRAIVVDRRTGQATSVIYPTGRQVTPSEASEDIRRRNQEEEERVRSYTRR